MPIEDRRAIHCAMTHDSEDIDEERRALARRWVDMARASKNGRGSGCPKLQRLHDPSFGNCPFP